MPVKEKHIYERKNLLLSIPDDVNIKFRDEARKREINMSDLLPRIIEERDYFEKKLIEKEKQNDESTYKIYGLISESLVEIRQSNFDLKIISKSLISIPTVTEEARKINEHCTKSANVIINFNKCVDEINVTISELRQKMNEYHKVLSSNKSNSEEIDRYLIRTKKLFENEFNTTASSLKKEKEILITQFKNDMKLKMDEILSHEKIMANKLNEFFNRKIFIFIVLWIVVSTFIAGLYIHDNYIKSGIDADKIRVFNDYKVALCRKSERTVENVDYEKLCN